MFNKWYASRNSFGGQRASIGRVVVVKIDGGELRAGKIEGIDREDTARPKESEDNPGFNHTDGVMISYSPDMGHDTAKLIRPDYFDVKSTEDIDAMPANSWCWPPRV